PGRVPELGLVHHAGGPQPDGAARDSGECGENERGGGGESAKDRRLLFQLHGHGGDLSGGGGGGGRRIWRGAKRGESRRTAAVNRAAAANGRGLSVPLQRHAGSR